MSEDLSKEQEEDQRKLKELVDKMYTQLIAAGLSEDKAIEIIIKAASGPIKSIE
jgi:hypothetical protein